MHFLMRNRLADWLRAHRAQVINLYLFANIIGLTVWQAFPVVIAHQFGLNECLFVAQNLVLAGVVILRQDHQRIDSHFLHQLVALAAFFSGTFFINQPASPNPDLAGISIAIIIAANLLGIFTLLNLGKSFGILIACRKIKTNGLYGVIRHPMYLSDILLRIGFAVGHFSILTLCLVLLSVGLYVWRALLEEAFLAEQGSYRDYMNSVRYRLLPGIF